MARFQVGLKVMGASRLSALLRNVFSMAVGASLLAAPAALAAKPPAHQKGPAHEALKLPKFLSFGKGNTAITKAQEKTLETVKHYLEAHPQITKLRIQGYYDLKDTHAQAEAHASQRASAAAQWLVKNGIDCKRLIAVAFTKGGDMREGGAYANFVNAELKGKPIGGMQIGRAHV